MSKERIQKALSEAGVCSRRKAEELIKEGKILVGGRPATIGMQIDTRKDIVDVLGKRVVFEKHPNKQYYALYKPRGYITTSADDFGRKIVTDLMKDIPGRLYPVGRLDKNSEGLIIMTNDGEFANFLMHPSNEIEKLYRVTTNGAVSENQLIKLSSGVLIDDKMTKTAIVRVIEKEPSRTVLQIMISEGRNRQIRKMFDVVNLQVKRLKRIAIGSVRLGMLQPGQHRPLTKEELAGLRRGMKVTETKKQGKK